MLKSTKTIRVSPAESALIDAIKATVFGELTDVDIEHQEPTAEKPLTAKEIALLEKVRDGFRHIDRITVHEAEPMQIDVKMTVAGFKCTRKLRL